MKQFRTLIQNAHPVVLFLYFSVFWGVLSFALGLTSGTSSFTLVSIGSRAVGAVLFGVAMTFFFLWQRKRAGGATMAISVNRAVKTGVLPPDAVEETWIPLLRRREKSIRLGRVLTPIVFGLFSVLGLYLIVLDSKALVVGSLCVVLCIGIGIYTVIAANRDLPKLRSLIAQLTDTP